MTPTDRRVHPGRIAAVALLVVAVYSGAVWIQANAALAAGDAIQDDADEAVARLNAGLAEFAGDPAGAERLRSELGKAGTRLERGRSQIASLRSAPLPHDAAARRTYLDALDAYVARTGDVVADATSTVGQVSKREDLVRQLSEGFGALNELAKPGAKVSDAARVLGGVQTTVDDVLEGLRSIDATGTGARPRRPLTDRLNAISTELESIQESLRTGDASRFVASSARFSELLKGDWRTPFLAANRSGVSRLAREAASLGALRDAAVKARSGLTTIRNIAGIALVLCAAGGVLVAAVSWLR